MAAMVKKNVKVTIAKAFAVNAEEMTFTEVAQLTYKCATSETRAKRDFKAAGIKFDVVKLVEQGTVTYAMPLARFIELAEVVDGGEDDSE